MTPEELNLLSNMQNYFANQRKQQEITNASDARVADAMARQYAMIQRNQQMAVDPDVVPFASPDVTMPPAINVGPSMFANVGPIEEEYEPENKAEAAAVQGIDYGGFKAQQNNKNQGLLSPEGYTGDSSFSIENLLGGVKDVFNDPFIATLFQIAAQPEAFSDPRGLGAGVATAGQKVFEAQAQAEKEAAAAQLEYDKLQTEILKAQAKAGGEKKLTDPVLKTINRTASAARGLQAIDAYRELLAAGPAGGIGGKFEQVVDRLAGLINFGEGTTADKANALRQFIISSLNTAASNGQLSKSDYDALEKVLATAGGAFTSNQKIIEQLNIIQQKLEQQQILGSNTLSAFGYDPEQLSPFKRRPMFIGKRP